VTTKVPTPKPQFSKLVIEYVMAPRHSLHLPSIVESSC
jgi:hypothetical protein